jgi:hypothetical protein
MSEIPPIRTIRVIGVVAKDGNVAPSREFIYWLERQARLVTGDAAVPTLGGVNTDGLFPVGAGNGDMPDLPALAIAAMTESDFAPALGVDQSVDLGPVAGGFPEMAGLEPV